MKTQSALRALLLGTSFIAAPYVQAATLYWDANGTGTAGSGDTPSGTWGTDIFWTTDSTGANVGSPVLTATTTSIDDLFFSAGTDAINAYIIGLNSATQSARLITFEDGTATLNTGTLNLSNGGGITVTSNTVTGATISTSLALSGRQTFNVAAGRSLTLDTGTFTRNAGSTLNILSTGTVTTTMTGLDSASLVNGIIGPWASFGSGASTTYATINGSNNIVGLGYTGGADGVSVATVAGVVTGGGSLNYTLSQATGTLGASASINTLRYTAAGGTLTTSTSFTTNGITNVGGGTLAFSGAITSGTGEMVIHAASGGINLTGLNNNGNLVTVTGSGDVNFNAGTYNGTGGITMNGSGTLNFQPAAAGVTYSGTTTLNAGTAMYYGNYGSGNITLNGGSLRFYYGSSMTRALGSGAGQIQIIGGNSGFDGNNGVCDINFFNDAREVQWGSAFFNPISLRFQDRATASNGSDRTRFRNALDLNAATRTISVNAATSTGYTEFSGVIRTSSGTAGLIKTGIGELRLSAANTYNGGTTVSAGVLNASAAAARLGSDTVGNFIAVSPGARLYLTGAANAGANQTITLTSTAGSLSVLGLGFNGLPSATIAQADTNGAVIAINAITGYTGNLSTALTGKNLFLGSIGTSTFTGAVGTVVAGNGSLYRLGGGGGSISFNTANLITGVNDVQIGSTATNGTGTVVFGASQNFTGATGVTVNNGSTLSLTASQAFTSPTVVNSGGTLSTSNTISVASAITNAGTLSFGGVSTFAGLVTTSTGVTFTSAGTHTFNGGLTLTSGTVSFSGNTNIAGSGLLTIATSTFNGTNGTVNIANDVKFNAGSTLTLTRPAGATPTFNFNGNVELAGNVNIVSGVSTTAGNTAFTGDISDPLGDFTLTFTGTGQSQTHTFSGDNSAWSGGIILNAVQTINLNSANASGTGNLALSAGTTNINHASFGTGALNLSGGTFNNNSGGALVLTNNNVLNFTANTTFTGTNSLSNGTGNFTINGTRTITVSANKLTLGGNQTTVVAGGIIKAGAGTLALLGSGVQTGAATISAGVLEVGVINNAGTTGGSSLGNVTTAAANLLMANGTTLRYVGSTNATTDRAFTINGTAAGHGVTIESSGVGTLSFTGAVALAYGTTAQTRTLTLGGTNTGANTFGKVIANNTGATNQTSLVKSGTGTWALTQVNTYSGATNINQGILAVNGTGSINNSAVTINGGNFRYNSTTAYTGALTFTSGAISGTNWTSSLDNLTIGANQTLSPGNSPGTAATGNQTWATGGSYEWEINSTLGSAGSDPGWDLINGTGTLNITAIDTGEFTIDVMSLTSGNVAGALSNFNGALNYNWMIANFNSITGFSADAFIIDTTQFALHNSFTGTFDIALGNTGSIGGTNSQIWLTYTAIPEPKAVLLGCLGVLLILRRRR